MAEDIKQKAFQSGFDLAGITDASPLDSDQFKSLTDWLASGCAGRMDYMRNNLDKRTNPAKLLKNAQSIICLGLNYNAPKTQNEITDPSVPMGTIANYARYEDYHPFIKKQLRKLTDFISSVAGAGFSFKICVDSAPLAERTFAARAGLGFIGKNRMLINPRLGPQLFLAEIVTNLKLPADKPVKSSCSNCSKCLTACPTGALTPDGRFDANKCISYLTIEYKDRFPADLAPKIGARLFGCDECVLACPYNAGAPVCKNKQFKFYPDRAKLNLNVILNMSEDDFETKFAGSPLNRLPLDCLKRNAKTCLANIAG
ncbi:MAG: tRNA epoxyqueuosine(34) reductase QueG [Phycisphaerae bacterium]|nr:tRNA epoxyqueuosine(34) reductase QueG [Phycisphaerae bacterium]